jgi:hypothetical protein
MVTLPSIQDYSKHFQRKLRNENDKFSSSREFVLMYRQSYESLEKF